MNCSSAAAARPLSIAAAAASIPAAKSACRVGDHERRRRVQQHDVAERALLAVEHAHGRSSALCAGVAAPEVRRRGPARSRGRAGRALNGGPRRRGARARSTWSVVVSSSSPSWPKKTIARSAPSSAQRRRCTRVGHRRVATRRPTWRGHPRRVRERAEEVERRRHAELGCAPDRRSASPGGTAARSRSRCRPRRCSAPRPSGPRSITTPSSSSTSAEPHCDDAARLPCFATRTPAPATTSAAIVEMLNVCERSPPVPQVSMSGRSRPRGRSRSARRTRASCAPARRAPRASRPWCAARPRTRATCASVAVAARGSSPSPRRPASGVRSSRRSQRHRARRASAARLRQSTGIAQSHQRSWSSTPFAMSPSCTWLVPSTIVSCFASR